MTNETAMIAQAGEPVELAIPSKAAFSYCCECGTYDAHAFVCTGCGFDFRGGDVVDEAE